MTSTIDKQEVLETLVARVQAALERLTSSQQTVQGGAVHEENRQEHAKDTRAIEQQYLARGLAERVERLRDDLTALAALKARPFVSRDPVALSALVRVEDQHGQESVYLIAPAGAGERLFVGGQEIQVLTPESPLGRALIGSRTDDEVEVDLPGGRTRFAVVGVQ